MQQQGPPPGPRPFMAVLPDYLPGAASLHEQLDRRILVVLRDGRNLVGVLRSFDQYSNMVLEDTFERHIVQGRWVRGWPAGLCGVVGAEVRGRWCRVLSWRVGP